MNLVSVLLFAWLAEAKIEPVIAMSEAATTAAEILILLPTVCLLPIGDAQTLPVRQGWRSGVPVAGFRARPARASGVFGRGEDFRIGAGGVFSPEDGRAGHHQGCSGCGHAAGGAGTDATVNLDQGVSGEWLQAGDLLR